MEHIRLETIIALGSASLLAYVLWGPKTSKTRSADAGGVLVGLQNVGNSCFVSAVLQAMASSAGVLAWLERPAAAQSPAHGRLRATLLRTLRVVNGAAGQQEVGSPAPLLACLQQLGWLIRRDEQDTHELFCLLISTLLEATPPVSELAALASSAARPDVDGLAAGAATGHRVASCAATPPPTGHGENQRCSAGLFGSAGPGSAQLVERQVSDRGCAGEGDAVATGADSERRDGATRHCGAAAMSGDTDASTALESDGASPLSEDSLSGGAETSAKLNKSCNGNASAVDKAGEHLQDSCGAVKLSRAGAVQTDTTAGSPGEYAAAVSPNGVLPNGHADGVTGRCLSPAAAPSDRAAPSPEVGALASSLQKGAAGPAGACGPLPVASGSGGSQLRSTWPRAAPAYPATERGVLHRVPGSAETPPPGVGPARPPFCGTVSTQLTCLACGHKCAVRWETFASLSLPLPAVSQQHSLSLPALLARFSARETVHGVSCDHCRRRAAFCKRTLVAKLPGSLCLHVPRTTWRTDGQPGKRADHVAFFETLNMYPYTYAANAKAGGGPHAPPPVTDSGRHTYRLTAVIVHTGEADSGHFVTYRRAGDPADPRWFYTSDTLVSRATRSEVFASAAYMFFYERLATTAAAAAAACHNR